MTSMLQAYNTHMKKEISEIDKAIEALIKAGRHVSQIEQRRAARTRKQERYEKRRKQLEVLIKARRIEEADEQFEDDTGAPFVPPKLAGPKKHSPRTTIKHKMMKKVVLKGGPIHPNLLTKGRTLRKRLHSE